MTNAEIRQLFRDDPIDEPRQTEDTLDFAENNSIKITSRSLPKRFLDAGEKLMKKLKDAHDAESNGDGIHDFATESPALNVGDEVLIVIPGRETALQRIKGMMVLTCFFIALGCAVVAVLNAPPEQVALTACILFLCGASVIERL